MHTAGPSLRVQDIEEKMSDRLLEDLFEASPDAIVLVDQEGIIRLVNRQIEALLGYDRDKLIGQSVEILIPERFHGGHVGFRNRYIATPMVRPMGAGRNLLARREDGSELAVDIMLSPLRNDATCGIIATLRDATERVRTEKMLSTSEALFKSLFDQAPDAIVAVNRSGLIARVNQQTEAMFGYSSDELLGKPIEILVPDRFKTSHVAQRQSYIDQPESRPMGAGLELSGQRKDGSEVPVDIMLSPVQLSNDGLVISVIRDVTERMIAAHALKERATQLDRSNKELEMFAYVASHDLQEPLRAVASSCQVLDRRLGDRLEADTRQFLQFATDGAKRMQALIDDLLSFSRVSRGTPLSAISLYDPFERALANLETKIGETKARIHVAGELPHALGDVGQLSQVFQNLIANAIKFRRPDVIPSVEVSAHFEKDHVVCSVKDNGIGIEQRFHNKVFALFQRLHTREQYAGTGIGLAISKKIIERHGGRIWVESHPGVGSTFFFTLNAVEGMPNA